MLLGEINAIEALCLRVGRASCHSGRQWASEVSYGYAIIKFVFSRLAVPRHRYVTYGVVDHLRHDFHFFCIYCVNRLKFYLPITMIIGNYDAELAGEISWINCYFRRCYVGPPSPL